MCKLMRKLLCTIVLVCAGFLLAGTTGKAYFYMDENSATGYQCIIQDDANLLSEAEGMQVMVAMAPITDYGNVAFVSTRENRGSATSYANLMYSRLFGTDDGTLFLVDMDNRMIYICSDGTMDKIITSDEAEIITDNVYRFASKAQYGDCACEAFSQIMALLKGEQIMRPMKYICNFLLALVIALSCNFAWMFHCARNSRPKDEEIIAKIPHYFNAKAPTLDYTHETTEPISSGSGGSGFRGGGRVGGGFRGGGRRAGGGHRF